MVIYNKLYAAWLAFRRHKKPSYPIDTFAYSVTANLQQLTHDIEQQMYQHGPYQAIVVHEKKRRDLAVASVRDRVVHRLVYDELMHVFDHMLDPDVWSCRPGKGLYGCLRRTQQILVRYPNTFVWRMDITKFFDNVNHATLLACLARKNLQPEIMLLCQQIIDSFHTQPGVGIPIGNLTSQVFANIYLNEFDRYVRHVLKPLAYVRYGDDVVMWAPNRRGAYHLQQHATQFLGSKLNLQVNPKNNVIVSASSGLHFLGHVITGLYTVVDRHTTKAVLRKSSIKSIASYKSLHLAAVPKKQLDW